MAHESVFGIVHVERPAEDAAVHVKFLQVIPNHLVADDVHVAKCARPVVVTAPNTL